MDNNSPRFIVARYLKDHGYEKTLRAFLAETDLPQSAIDSHPGDWNLEQILKEKRLYDQNLNFEKGPDTISSWTLPCPTISVQPKHSDVANALAVTASIKSKQSYIAASFVKNTLGFWSDAQTPKSTNSRSRGSANSLSLVSTPDHLVTSKMDGTLDFYDSESSKLVATLKVHTSYINQVVAGWDDDRLVLATAGWDRRVCVLSPLTSAPERDQSEPENESTSVLSPAITAVSVASNAQSVVFARHPDTQDLYVVYTRRDSIYLHYLLLTPEVQHDGNVKYTATPTGRQSLAPQQHSTWTSFTPAHIEVCPTDTTLVAIATSHTPSMKVIVTRLLFPSPQESMQSASTIDQNSINHATKDELAIRLVANTNAPQNDYSTPRCVWRPDGSGIWVSADDGVVRGIDASTGKVVKQLKGHDPGTKIRCLWAGTLPDSAGGNREVLISGGFDKKLLVWEIE